jgi:hypothetical protein
MKPNILVLAALAAITAVTGSKAVARIGTEPESVLKLEPYRRGVAVRVNANGKPGLFVFDSAGGVTVISPAFAKQAGCMPWGQEVGYSMTGARFAAPRCDNFAFSVNGTRLVSPVAGVMDVAPLLSKDAEPIEGLLALDVFADKTITIDPAGGRLIVESARSARDRIVGAHELPISIARENGGIALATYVLIPTAKGPLRFEIDSGNGGTLLVSKAYAEMLGLDPAAEKPVQGSFKVADGIEARGLIFVKDININGNLGMPFLKDWVITLDLKHSRMWIQPSKVAPPPGMGVPPPLPAS